MSVRSPPESSEMLRGCLPGGRATIDDAALEHVAAGVVFENDVGLAAGEQPAEDFLKMPAHLGDGIEK